MREVDGSPMGAFERAFACSLVAGASSSFGFDLLGFGIVVFETLDFEVRISETPGFELPSSEVELLGLEPLPSCRSPSHSERHAGLSGHPFRHLRKLFPSSSFFSKEMSSESGIG
jgi:hypothetical protein